MYRADIHNHFKRPVYAEFYTIKHTAMTSVNDDVGGNNETVFRLIISKTSHARGFVNLDFEALHSNAVSSSARYAKIEK